MLKTNSRQARENLKAYIMKNWNIETEEQGKTWKEKKTEIIETFERCAYRSEYERKQKRGEAFAYWLSGLPRSLGDFYLNQAVKDLGDILEQTEDERNRYEESESERVLSYLIYREVNR